MMTIIPSLASGALSVFFSFSVAWTMKTKRQLQAPYETAAENDLDLNSSSSLHCPGPAGSYPEISALRKERPHHP